MDNIIQQISEKLTKKILEKAYSGGICDIDLLSSSVLEDCKSAARDILEAIVSDLNIKIREDKPSRKARGLILKEKNRERSLLTELGRLDLPRDYYYDKKEEKYDYLLDRVIGLQGYERISAGVRAKLVSMATEVSYAKSAETVTGDQVSRQCVRECILKLGAIEKRPQPYEPKRKVKELHLFADEDHVHMQREGRAKGKKSRMVPLVTVTEGIEKESKGRNRTRNAMHFVDENFDTKALWKSVEGYIGASYDIESIEKIYIHADGGKWITNGLESFSNVTGHGRIPPGKEAKGSEQEISGEQSEAEDKSSDRKRRPKKARHAYAGDVCKESGQEADRIYHKAWRISYGKLRGDKEQTEKRYSGKLHRRTGEPYIVNPLQPKSDGMERRRAGEAIQAESLYQEQGKDRGLGFQEERKERRR